jgi:pilus assembly protein CpaB
MARAGAGGSGSRINGRFMLLTIVFAGLSAVLVYAGVARSSGKENAPAGETGTTVVAKVDIPARTQITVDMLELKEIPVDSRALTALSSVDDVVGKVALYPIALDEQVTPSKIVSVGGSENADSLAFAVPQGMRAISISADQVVSAGGLVLPGDYVDIISVLQGTKPDGNTIDNYVAKTILQNVQVLAVAQKIAETPSGGDNTSSDSKSSGSSSKPNPDATTLTILTTPQQAEVLFLAESNGTLRAIVRGYGDSDVTQVPPVFQNELLPPVAP